MKATPLPEFTAPMLDHARLDLDAAERICYRIEQRFRYQYDSPITALSQRLIIVPRPRHGDLVRRAHRVEVAGAPARRRVRQDAAGNTVVRVSAPRVEHSVEFRVVAVVERVRQRGAALLPASALEDRRLRRPTRLTAADDRLRAMADDLVGARPSELADASGVIVGARPSELADASGVIVGARPSELADASGVIVRPGGAPLEVAERICRAVHAALPYEYGVTGVRTTAAEALAGGRGVCQDSAHIMIALCHLAGLPVRYVSGHLLGQGGTHAWVEVIVPHGHAATAVAFDPCHGRRTTNAYVTVAVGRDYADVAPTSGSYIGAPGGRLTGVRQVGVVALDRPVRN